MLSKLIKGQKGQALPIVLVLLVLGGLVIAPTLRYASTSLKGHEVLERKSDELYAADSGIDYALFKLSNGETEDIGDYQLNGKTVSVNITGPDGEGNYLITSTATTAGVSSTTIRTGVSSSGGFAFLFDSAITSPNSVDLKNESNVAGNITCPNEPTGQGTYDPDSWDSDLTGTWPTADFFDTFYEDVVLNEGATPVGDTTINSGSYSLENPCPVEPLYVDGKLTVEADFIRLDGTVYVTGDIEFKNTCTIILNGQTIFAKGNIDLKNGFTSIGNGCIIAIGDVLVHTSGDTDEFGFLFLMSISDTVQVNNGDNIYGCIAGETKVELKNGCDLTWVSAPSGEGALSFPAGSGVSGSSTGDMVLGGWDVS